jgi:hypothetical protein
MKKFLIVFAISIVSNLESKSQVLFDVGLNSSKVFNSTEDLDIRYITTPFVGIGYKLTSNINEALVFKPFLHFESRGFKFNTELLNRRFAQTYLSLGGLASYAALDWLALELGAQGMFTTSTKNEDDSYTLNTFVLESMFGITFHTQTALHPFIRYAVGITPSLEATKVSAYGETSKHQIFQSTFNIGLQIQTK